MNQTGDILGYVLENGLGVIMSDWAGGSGTV
jgi:hypothetical protein